MMRLTTAAVEQIRFLVAQHGGPPLGLRLAIAASGCAGTTWVFGLELPQPDAIVIAHDGVCLAVAPDALPFVRDATLDYGAQLRPPRFRLVRAATVPWRCPCGRSFGQPFPGKPTPQCQAYTPMPWDAPTASDGSGDG